MAVTRVDQFESVFRAAAKPVYEYRIPEIRKALIASDLDKSAGAAFETRISEFLAVLPGVTWTSVGGDAFASAGDLVALVDGQQFDLVVTYRHLHSDAWKWPHSLGAYLDLLTQAVGCPVLVVPHPQRDGAMPHAVQNTDVVMAITDHLSGDARLINYGALFTSSRGTLHLTHVEDEATFARYVDVISKIPSIDTESAEEQIRERLLVEPWDYVASCQQVLSSAGVDLEVVGSITMGHRLAEYRRLIEAHAVDLLIMNTKDDDQLAMHGMVYPLAVDLRDIPLLML